MTVSRFKNDFVALLLWMWRLWDQIPQTISNQWWLMQTTVNFRFLSIYLKYWTGKFVIEIRQPMHINVFIKTANKVFWSCRYAVCIHQTGTQYPWHGTSLYSYPPPPPPHQYWQDWKPVQISSLEVPNPHVMTCGGYWSMYGRKRAACILLECSPVYGTTWEPPMLIVQTWYYLNCGFSFCIKR